MKTGGPDEATARRKAAWYEPQRQAYLAALAAITGRPVEQFAFHFTGTNVAVGGPVTPEEIHAATVAVRDQAEQMRQGDPALTDHPAECAWCGYKVAGWCPGVG